MRYEMTTRNGEPAIRVRLNYDEAREYLALDEDAIALLDSLTESERKAMTLELYLVPLREVAEYAVGTAGKPTDHLPALSAATTTWEEDDYDEALHTLDGIDRAAYLHVLDRAGREVEYYVRMDSLPSAPIPEGVDTAYPVWAVDKRGMALVGPGADEVESVEEVRAWCEEHARRMRGIPLRCHKCGHIWTYRGRSHYRTTCPACHITVYLDKCKIFENGHRRSRAKPDTLYI